MRSWTCLATAALAPIIGGIAHALIGQPSVATTLFCINCVSLVAGICLAIAVMVEAKRQQPNISNSSLWRARVGLALNGTILAALLIFVLPYVLAAHR